MTLVMLVNLPAPHAHLLMLVILVKDLLFKMLSRLDIVIVLIQRNGLTQLAYATTAMIFV